MKVDGLKGRVTGNFALHAQDALIRRLGRFVILVGQVEYKAGRPKHIRVVDIEPVEDGSE